MKILAQITIAIILAWSLISLLITFWPIALLLIALGILNYYQTYEN